MLHVLRSLVTVVLFLFISHFRVTMLFHAYFES